MHIDIKHKTTTTIHLYSSCTLCCAFETVRQKIQKYTVKTAANETDLIVPKLKSRDDTKTETENFQGHRAGDREPSTQIKRVPQRRSSVNEFGLSRWFRSPNTDNDWFHISLNKIHCV